MLSVRPAISSLAESAVTMRRALHRIPEPAFTGVRTQAYLLDALRKTAPDELIPLAETGVKAVYRAKHATRTIAFRADTDALPIAEQTGLPFASSIEGCMHACGHDGHMAILLLFMQYVASIRASLTVNVVLLFQPGEEGFCGASRMIDEGALQNPHVDEIYALHLWPALPAGLIGLHAGPLMASAQSFDVCVHGKSAHGATPHLGVDAIVIAAELISLYQTVVSRSVDPKKEALLSIGRIEGGDARNIVAQETRFFGTLRALDDSVLQAAFARMQALTNGLAAAYETSIDLVREVWYPCVNNPSSVIEPLYALFGQEHCAQAEPVLIAEDFSFYQQTTPGAMLFLGVGDESHNESLHSARFTFDESLMPVGAEAFARILGAFSGRSA